MSTVHKMKTKPTGRTTSDGKQLHEPVDESLCGKQVNHLFGSLSGAGVTCDECAAMMRSEQTASA